MRECGSNFLLRKRYIRPHEPAQTDYVQSPRYARRIMLTAPIGGVAGGDEAILREEVEEGGFK